MTNQKILKKAKKFRFHIKNSAQRDTLPVVVVIVVVIMRVTYVKHHVIHNIFDAFYDAKQDT